MLNQFRISFIQYDRIQVLKARIEKEGGIFMAKDARLVNIYIKIHNKDTLTIDDLRYLAKYDPECFEKTCKNIVYKIPETKEIMQPKTETPQKQLPVPTAPVKPASIWEKTPPDRKTIEAVLENLKKLETEELPIQNVPADSVKELLGSLYMEKMFPHNDKERFFEMPSELEEPFFNKKA